MKNRRSRTIDLGIAILALASAVLLILVGPT
jgi:hypothetical protein